MSINESTRKVGKFVRNHVVDTTGMLATTFPLCSAVEVFINRMSNQVSRGAKYFGAELSYAGLGFAFAKGRDVSRRVFGVNDQSSELVKGVHDGLYTAAFNVVATPFIYWAQGADFKEGLLGGVSMAVLSPVTGPLAGYGIDVMRDLTGLGECNRSSYPDVVKNRSPAVKKGLAALLAAGSIAAMGGIYSLNSYLSSHNTDQSAAVVESAVQEAR